MLRMMVSVMTVLESRVLMVHGTKSFKSRCNRWVILRGESNGHSGSVVRTFGHILYRWVGPSLVYIFVMGMILVYLLSDILILYRD